MNVQLIELHARLLRPDPIATRVDPMRRVGVSGGVAWLGLVLRTGCFEGCWLLLVVLRPLACVLVG